MAALWGGQKGSLMLWSLILAIYSVVVVRPGRSPEPRMMGGVAAVMMAIMTFFLTLANFSTPASARRDDRRDGIGGIVKAVHEVEGKRHHDQPGDDAEAELTFHQEFS